MKKKKKLIQESDQNSYRQIIKSTSIMGGSTAINIILRMVRMKVLAVLLGPSGVGIIGIFDSITALVNSVAGMGVETSGVRQIAEANASGDNEKIARTIITLRRTALFTGLFGLIILLLLSYPLSLFTFGNNKHVMELGLLSVTILFTAITGGQTALIQGMQRIRDLAVLSIFGALWGTIFSIPIVYFFGEKGIVVFLIVVSAMSLITSWWFSRKIKVPDVQMSLSETLLYLKPLLKLGFVFMSTALMSMGSIYLIRVFIVRYLGLDAAGMYQAATVLSALYVGFILDAMGKDFYPRLTGIANNQPEFIALVNRQLEIGLLMAVPGVLATMTLSQFVIEIFYSVKFIPAYEILRWQLLGDILRVVTWPLGYMIIAKGNSRIFFWTELLTRCSHLLFIWIGITYFGLIGTGIAFFAMYVFSGIITLFAVIKIYKFKWSFLSLKILTVTTLVTGLIFIIPMFLSDTLSLVVNILIIILMCLYSIRTLYTIIGRQAFTDLLLKIKSKFI